MNVQAARLSQLTAYFKLREGYASAGEPVPQTAAASPASRASIDGVSPAPAAPAAVRRRERRSGERPWSHMAAAPDTTQSLATHAASGHPSAVASSGHDWSEF
jgi:hypothetical protein